MINLKNKGITSIGEVIQKIPTENKSYNILDLQDNQIKFAELYKLPEQIKHVNLYNNEVQEINFGTREWGIINIGNNGLEIYEIANLNCEKLDLTDNLIEEITLICCNIGELIISNNSLKEINFIECFVNKLNLSSNKLIEITHLPQGIKDLNLCSNRIKDICELPDTIIILILSENKLKVLPNIPKNIIKLDLNNNRLTTFDVGKIPDELSYLDLQDNLISETDDLFAPILDKIETLYYDEERENITDNKIESDDESNISVNIISKKSRSISFDSIKSNDVLLKSLGLDSKEEVSYDSDDSDDIEIISKTIKDFNNKKKQGLLDESYREINWSKFSSESEEDKSDEKSEEKSEENKLEPNYKKIYLDEESQKKLRELRLKNLTNNAEFKLSEDHKIMLEIIEANKNKINMVWANKSKIDLKWNIEL